MSVTLNFCHFGTGVTLCCLFTLPLLLFDDPLKSMVIRSLDSDTRERERGRGREREGEREGETEWKREGERGREMEGGRWRWSERE